MRFPARISRSLISLRPGGRAAQEPMLVAGTSQLLADTVAKLPKSRATNFPQIDQTSRKSPTDVSSRPLPKSPVSSSQDNVVPQIIIRSPYVRPGKFVLVDAKRVLQQYRHAADIREPRPKRPSLPPLPDIDFYAQTRYRDILRSSWVSNRTGESRNDGAKKCSEVGHWRDHMRRPR